MQRLALAAIGMLCLTASAQQPSGPIFQSSEEKPATNLSELHFRVPMTRQSVPAGINEHMPAQRRAMVRGARSVAPQAARCWNSPAAIRAASGKLNIADLPSSLKPFPAKFNWPSGSICTQPDVYVNGPWGWTFRDDKGATIEYDTPGTFYADEQTARVFANSIQAALPLFVPFRDPAVDVGQGWLYSSGDLHAAVDYLRVTPDGYGPGKDPSFDVYALADGKVIWTDWDDLTGNFLIIEYTAPGGAKFRSIYCHLRNGKQHDIQMALKLQVADKDKFDSTGHSTRQWRYYQFARKAQYLTDQLWGTNNQTILVKPGDWVHAGQLIAHSGNTGWGGAGWGLDDSGNPTNPYAANNHLHLFMAVPDPGGSGRWVLIDPYGIYNQTPSADGSQCYGAMEQAPFVRLFAPFYPSFHNVPAELVSKYFGYYTGMGMGLQTLNLDQYNGSVLASGAFESGLNPDWYARFYLTAADYQKYFDQYFKQGYRPREMEVTIAPDGSPRFGSIWKRLSNETFYTFLSLSDADYTAKWNQYVVNGKMRVEDHVQYFVKGSSQHAVTFVNDGDTAFYEYHGLTGAALQSKFDDLYKSGFRMVSLHAAESPGGVVYGGVWRKEPGAWAALGNLTPSQYQERFLEYNQQGFRVFRVQGYSNSSRFAAVWTKP